jgi:purine nucleosidase/pyrimidine-specific ribonucleoside hydrolase
MIKKKIILDTDIGDDVDDSFAIALALESQSIEIIGITTVYKNSSMRAKIVKAELEAFGKTDIDVVSGLDKPLFSQINKFSYEKTDSNGKPIITAYNNSYVTEADRDDAPNYLLEKAKEFPHEISLVAIGPLTNLAAAIKKDKDGFRLFKEIIMMGGSNTNSKEWNIVCDPESADIVLNCGIPITMIPIECTIKCALTDKHYSKVLNPKTKEQRFLLNMYIEWRKNQTRPCQMHDCLAVEELVKSFCTFDEKHIAVGLDSDDRGKTISIEGRKPNARIAMRVDNDAFMSSLLNVLYS